MKLTAAESDAELHVFLMHASFASTTGRGKFEYEEALKLNL